MSSFDEKFSIVFLFYTSELALILGCLQKGNLIEISEFSIQA